MFQNISAGAAHHVWSYNRFVLLVREDAQWSATLLFPYRIESGEILKLRVLYAIMWRSDFLHDVGLLLIWDDLVLSLVEIRAHFDMILSARFLFNS